MRSPLLDHARDATEPSSEAIARVTQRVRETLAGEPHPASALRALPDPDAGAIERIRRRLLGRRSDRARWPLAAALIAASIVAIVVVTRAPPVPRAPAAEPAPIVEAAPPVPIVPPPSAPVASPKSVIVKAPKAALKDIAAFGGIDRASADRALHDLAAALAACATDTPVRVSLSIDADGAPKGVAVEGEDRVAACVTPILMRAHYGAAPGLRAGPQDGITGGVIRFSFVRDNP